MGWAESVSTTIFGMVRVQGFVGGCSEALSLRGSGFQGLEVSAWGGGFASRKSAIQATEKNLTLEIQVPTCPPGPQGYKRSAMILWGPSEGLYFHVIRWQVDGLKIVLTV